MSKTFLTISPGANSSGFCIADGSEIKKIFPLNLKGLAMEAKEQRLIANIRSLVYLFQPEFVLVEAIDGKRKTLKNKILLGFVVNFCLNLGLSVKYFSIDQAKKAICPEIKNPGWQEVVNTISRDFCSSIEVSNFIQKLFPKNLKSFEDCKGARFFPLSDVRRYYFPALLALTLCLGYQITFNEQKYESINA